MSNWSCCSCLGDDEDVEWEALIEMVERLRELELVAKLLKEKEPDLRKVQAQRQERRWNSSKKLIADEIDSDSAVEVSGHVRPSLPCASSLLMSPSLKQSLTPHLPRGLRGREWHEIFSTEKHGTLAHLYQRCAKYAVPSVMVVMDAKRRIFGAFNPLRWQPQKRLRYYGNNSVFLFSSSHEGVKVHRSTHANSHFVLAAYDSIALGGGGEFGLWLDSDFTIGTSGPCPTFGNKAPISSTEDFEVVSMEMWGIFESEELGGASPMKRGSVFSPPSRLSFSKNALIKQIL